MTIQKINDRNLRVADKLCRMLFNFGSLLITIEGDLLIIEANLSRARGWPKNHEVTARQIANDYALHFKEGYKPSGYRKKLFTTIRRKGMDLVFMQRMHLTRKN